MKTKHIFQFLILLGCLLGTVRAVAADRLYLDTEKIKPGETKDLAFCLDNSQPFYGFQLNISLPEGLTFVKGSNNKPVVTSSPRVNSSFSYVSNLVSESYLRLGTFSLTHSAFTEETGVLFYVKVQAADDFAGGTLSVSELLFINESDNDVELPDYSAEIRTNDENRFFISDFSISAGETKTVSMELSNETVFTAFQTDIYLPAGLSIVDNSFKFTGRSSDHMLTSKKSADGFTRLAGISMSSTEISGNSGALVTFDVVADKAIAETSVIELKNQLFSTPDAREYVLPDASTTVTKVEGPTAVAAVGLAGVNISVGDNELVIENAPKDKVVCLYDADGKLVQKAVSQEGVTRMPINSTRMYILSIDGVSVKITAK